MPVLTIILVLVLVGFILWFVETKVPMDATIKRILEFVVILVVILWLLQVFGVLGSLNQVRVR